MWPSGDLQKSKRLRREAGEWEEESENKLKQEVGKTSLQTTSIFQALAEKESRVREATGQRNTMRGRESSRAGEVYLEGNY